MLSFPIVEMEDGEIKSNLGDIDMEENIMLLGDIVISLETHINRQRVWSFFRKRIGVSNNSWSISSVRI